jgi:hypothetical protein
MSVVKEIITNLIESTSSGETTWELSKSIFNSDTCKYYESKSIDGKTTFKVQVYLSSKLLLEPTMTNFFIHNTDLVNGYNIFTPYEFNELKELGQIIYDRYVKSSLPHKNQNDTYQDILENSFSKQHIRDKKLSSILGDSKEDTIQQKEVVEKPKKESFFSKLFR